MRIFRKKWNFSELIKKLSDIKGKVVITDAGQSYFNITNDLKLYEGDSLICSGSQADMGFGLPASIGACIALSRPVILVTGDGSFQFNIQELQTIVRHNLPIKIIVINNNGYDTIRKTQNRLGLANVGVDTNTGVSFPSLKKIAKSYGIKYQTDFTKEDMVSSNQAIIEICV